MFRNLNTWTSKIILDNPERLKIDATYLLTVDEGVKKKPMRFTNIISGQNNWVGN